MGNMSNSVGKSYEEKVSDMLKKMVTSTPAANSKSRSRLSHSFRSPREEFPEGSFFGFARHKNGSEMSKIIK